MKTYQSALFKYLAALLFFGSNGTVAASIALSAQETVFFRAMFGSIFLTAVFFLSGRRLHLRNRGKDLAMIALSGFASAADWFFLFEAYRQIGVSLSILISYFGPVLVIVFSALFLGERMNIVKVSSLAAALTGVVLISGRIVVTGLPVSGLICAVMSAVCYTALVLFSRQAKNIRGMDHAVLQLLFTFLGTAVFIGVHEGFAISVKPGDWPALLWLGVINTGIACHLYFTAIGALPVQTVAVCGYLEPLSAVLFSAVFLGERLGGWQMIGAILILGGALVGEMYNGRIQRLQERGTEVRQETREG